MHSDIPDSINPEQLQQILNAAKTGLPSCDLFPSLNFGSERGGALDLQIAIMQLMRQAASEPNSVQKLCAAAYLLGSVAEEFSEMIAAINHKEPPFNDIPSDIHTFIMGGAIAQRSTICKALSLVSTVANSGMMVHANQVTDRMHQEGQQEFLSDPRRVASEVVLGQPYLDSISMERSSLDSVIFDQGSGS